MDMGVSSVMFSSGLTARAVREGVLKSNEQRNSMIKELFVTFKNCVLIFIIGFGRFFLHKGIDYHVILMTINQIESCK